VSTLRLVGRRGLDLDAPVASVGTATLIRRADGLYVEVAPGDVRDLVRAFAFAGIDAVDAVTPPVAADIAGHVAAVGTRLEPLPPATFVLDVVRVRRLAVGEATREVLRRRLAWLRPPSDEARRMCRRLLWREDAFLAWDRRAWIARAAIRDRAVRACLRPVVFDRRAADRMRERGRSFVTDRALARWAS